MQLGVLIVVFCYFDIFSVELPIAMQFVSWKPPFIFRVIWENKCPFSFLHVPVKRTIVLVVLGLMITDTLTFALPEISFIEITIFVKQFAFSLHFAIWKLTFVFSILGLQLSASWLVRWFIPEILPEENYPFHSQPDVLRKPGPVCIESLNPPL